MGYFGQSTLLDTYCSNDLKDIGIQIFLWKQVEKDNIKILLGKCMAELCEAR